MKDLAQRGEVWWCELPAAGRRPVVVLSRNVAIPRLGRALVAPCTTTIRGLPSEVVLEPGEDPIPLASAVNLDSVESVSVGVLVERLGTLSGSRMRECVRCAQRWVLPQTATEGDAPPAGAPTVFSQILVEARAAVYPPNRTSGSGRQGSLISNLRRHH